MPLNSRQVLRTPWSNNCVKPFATLTRTVPPLRGGPAAYAERYAEQGQTGR
jgi:hypothetical protein